MTTSDRSQGPAETVTTVARVITATDTGPWRMALRRLARDRVGSASALVVASFLLLMVGAATGLVAGGWSEETALSYAPPGMIGAAPGRDESGDRPAETGSDTRQDTEDLGIVDPLAEDLAQIERAGRSALAGAKRSSTAPFGADKWGRDVLLKTVKGSETSILVGLSAALLATLIGTLLGAQAGYRGGRVDDAMNWLYSVLTSMPYMLLVLAVAAVLGRKGTLTVILILGLTGWTGIFRLVRAEYLKHRVREYVLAAQAIGASDSQRMFLHILPNISHVVLVQLSLHVVLFIKFEVVLSFLGFGVGVDTVSWGSMLSESQTELLLGYWWQFVAATGAMAVLVTAFSLFTDSLRDALDGGLQ